MDVCSLYATGFCFDDSDGSNVPAYSGYISDADLESGVWICPVCCYGDWAQFLCDSVGLSAEFSHTRRYSFYYRCLDVFIPNGDDFKGAQRKEYYVLFYYLCADQFAADHYFRI